MPANTKVAFEPETVRRAMDIPNIIGLKDSSANMIYFHHLIGLLPQRPDWTLLVGPEELLAEAVLAGGHGGICGGANICPKLYVDLYHAAMAGKLDRVAQLHRRVMRLAKSIYQVGRHNSAVIKGIKCSLACLGICDDFMAEPFHRFRPEERAQIQKHLDELGIR
jgi:4-hydroxy-tetrahydrodipicolinate synthase